ncbi:MAG: C45 family peptidase [Polyangiaceae bacterium]
MKGLAARLRNHKKKLIALTVLVLGPCCFHVGVGLGTGIDPPPVATPPGEVRETGDLRTFGDSYATHRGPILEVGLKGTPEQIGYSHSRLLYREMVQNEGTLYGQFEHYVPLAPVRWLIVDVSRLQFRGVDQGMPEERRKEIAAQALGFSPDPYSSFLPTYQRLVFLQSLYDIALSFEHSPLLGCTSFTLKGAASAGGHAILARNFDFEAGPIFDVGKAVFLVRQDGRIPYASVAWPGLVGTVSGMNAEGFGVVVHGARAKEPQPQGEPVVHTVRDLLGRARTTAEAIDLLREKKAMVPHMLLLIDATGDSAVVERIPGEPLFVRLRRHRQAPLTNHLEGPFARDPANKRVESTTSTCPPPPPRRDPRESSARCHRPRRGERPPRQKRPRRRSPPPRRPPHPRRAHRHARRRHGRHRQGPLGERGPPPHRPFPQVRPRPPPRPRLPPRLRPHRRFRAGRPHHPGRSIRHLGSERLPPPRRQLTCTDAPSSPPSLPLPPSRSSPPPRPPAPTT